MTENLIMGLIASIAISCIGIMKLADSKEIAWQGAIALIITTFFLTILIYASSPSSQKDIITAKLYNIRVASGLIECQYEVIGSNTETASWMKPESCFDLAKLKLREMNCLDSRK